MNEFIMLNWYHFDLNYKIINYLKKRQSIKSDYKKITKNRMDQDFKLKIKKD